MEEKETRSLSVMLTEEEARAKGIELASYVQQLNELEERAKQISADMKKEIKALQAKVMVLTRIVRTGKEDREVECYERRNNSLMTIETYRTDTGELVETRPMSANERQLAMFPQPLRAVGRSADLATDAAETNCAIEESYQSASLEAIDALAKQQEAQDEHGDTEEAPATPSEEE